MSKQFRGCLFILVSLVAFALLAAYRRSEQPMQATLANLKGYRLLSQTETNGITNYHYTIGAVDIRLLASTSPLDLPALPENYGTSTKVRSIIGFTLDTGYTSDYAGLSATFEQSGKYYWLVITLSPNSRFELDQALRAWLVAAKPAL